MFAEFFTPEQIAIVTQIILIDLVLAGDNAIIIKLLANNWKHKKRRTNDFFNFF